MPKLLAATYLLATLTSTALPAKPVTALTVLPAVPLTEVFVGGSSPMKVGSNWVGAELVVPNQNLTKAIDGTQLRLYDVHVAKMFEVTDHICHRSAEAGIKGIAWSYKAGKGQIPVGNFKISCRLANNITATYDLGTPRLTTIRYFAGTQKPKAYPVPSLNITNGKVTQWKAFVQGCAQVDNFCTKSPFKF
jgi:serine/threonine-protein kinase